MAPLCDALDQNKLLIIDEIHRVFTTHAKLQVMRCLDALRHIHDRTLCGLVLCGTNVFRDRLKEGEFFQYLKQLKRRGIYQLQLPSVPPDDDLKAIASHYGLSWPSDSLRNPSLPSRGTVLDIISHIAHEDGLAVYCTRLQDAIELANKKKQPVSWDHFVKAHNIAIKMAREVK